MPSRDAIARIAGVLVLSLVSGCGAVPILAPRDTTRIPEVSRWASGSTSELVDGDIVLRFEGWPAPDPPIVAMCREEPARIWAPDGTAAFPGSPGCTDALPTRLEDGVLRVWLDRDALLTRFGDLEAWSRVMAYEDAGGRWSAVSDYPAAVVREAE